MVGKHEECLNLLIVLGYRLVIVVNYSNDGQFPLSKKYQNIHLYKKFWEQWFLMDVTLAQT
jgi:hypothetical protein